MKKRISEPTTDWTQRDAYPADLQGPAQNKWGGHKAKKLRSYRQNTFGPASECRHFTAEQIAKYAAEHGYTC